MLTLLAALLISCGSKPPDFGNRNSGGSSRGLFSSEGKQQLFLPCAAKARWSWSKAYPNDADWQRVQPLFDASCDKEEDPYCGLVYMEVDGRVSEPGHYGPAGKYEREIVVAQIHYASLDIPADCKRQP